MNRSQLEGLTEAVNWLICLNRILLCNGSRLAASFGFAYHRSYCSSSSNAVAVEKININIPYIDKRISTLELLTQRHKLSSQFPYLLRKFVYFIGTEIYPRKS